MYFYFTIAPSSTTKKKKKISGVVPHALLKLLQFLKHEKVEEKKKLTKWKEVTIQLAQRARFTVSRTH